MGFNIANFTHSHKELLSDDDKYWLAEDGVSVAPNSTWCFSDTQYRQKVVVIFVWFGLFSFHRLDMITQIKLVIIRHMWLTKEQKIQLDHRE